MCRGGRVGRIHATEHTAFSRHLKSFLRDIVSNLEFSSWRWVLLPSKALRLPSKALRLPSGYLQRLGGGGGGGLLPGLSMT